MKNRYRSAAAEGLFLFGIKKKQNRGIAELIITNENNKKIINKMPAENLFICCYIFQLHS